MTFLSMSQHWHWHYVIPGASSMESLHSLGQGNKNEVQQGFLFGLVTPLVLGSMSHNASSSINGTITFLS